MSHATDIANVRWSEGALKADYQSEKKLEGLRRQEILGGSALTIRVLKSSWGD
jgi:hypothetical protein